MHDRTELRAECGPQSLASPQLTGYRVASQAPHRTLEGARNRREEESLSSASEEALFRPDRAASEVPASLDRTLADEQAKMYEILLSSHSFLLGAHEGLLGELDAVRGSALSQVHAEHMQILSCLGELYTGQIRFHSEFQRLWCESHEPRGPS